MTSKARCPPAPVDDVKRDLHDASTTTSHTLSLLRALLSPNDDQTKRQTTAKDPTKAPPGKSQTRSKITGAPRRPVTKKATPIPIHEDSSTSTAPLDTKSRRLLATEVFNTTLKTLTNAAKIKLQSGDRAPEPKRRTPARKPSSPLKEGSHNQNSQRDRGKYQLKDDTSLDATADCASVALECLRSLEEEGKEGQGFDLRLEQGALILLDKTMTLQLFNQAESQIRRLYEQYWKRRKFSEKTEELANADNGTAPTFVVGVEEDKSAFKLATSLQSQFLRLAVLKGPIWISEHLVEGMRPTTPGGPAYVVVEGRSLGHLNDEDCGMQLRTISLALTKLQSMSIDKSASPRVNPRSSLKLAVIALQIKIFSWKYLGHKPELPKELWLPMKRHIQHYISTSKEGNFEDSVRPTLQLLRNALFESGFNPEVPTEVSRLVGESPVPDVSGDIPIENRLEALPLDTTEETLFACLDSAAASLTTAPTDVKHIQCALERLRGCIDQQSSLGRSILTKVFIKIARVRKAVLETAESIEREALNGPCDHAKFALYAECVRTIYSFLTFAFRCVKESSTSKGQHGTETEDSLMLTYAKNVEAVLLIEQRSVTRTAELSSETVTALLRCLEMGKLVESRTSSNPSSAKIRSFFTGIPVRVSQAFWNRFLWLSERTSPASECVKVLELSIESVQRRPLGERQSALLGVKYERLARLLEEVHSYSKAMLVLEQAIRLGIDARTLEEAADVYLLRDGRRIWTDQQTTFYNFGIILASYSRLSLKVCDSETTGLWIFDDQTLPVLHQFIVMEHQIVSVLRTGLILTKGQLTLAVDHLLGILDNQEQEAHQLGFLSEILFLLGRHGKWTGTDVLTSSTIGRLTMNVGVEDNAEKSPDLQLLKLLVSVQWALAQGQLDEDRVVYFITRLKSEMDGTGQVNRDRSGKLNLQILAAQLRALADFAAVLGNDQSQYDALTSLLRLQQQDPVLKKDRAATLIQLGTVQNRLNRSELAGTAFAQAEKLLGLSEPTPHQSVTWTLAYADYLLNINHVGKSKELLQIAHTHYRDSGNNHGETSHTRLEREMSVCEAALLSSRVAFHQGRLDEAHIRARHAMRLSTSLWISVEKKLQTLPNSANKSSAHDIVEEFSSLTLAGGRPKLYWSQGARFWTTISLHRRVLQHTAFVFHHFGLYEDALYYSQQMDKIVKVTGGRTLRTFVSAELARLYGHAAQTEKATTLISSISASESFTDRLDLVLSTGEAFASIGKWDQARECVQRLIGMHQPLLTEATTPSAVLEPPRQVAPTKKPIKAGTGRKVKPPTKAVPPAQHAKAAAPTPPAKAIEASAILTLSQCELLARTVVLNNTLRQADDSHNRASSTDELVLDPSVLSNPMVMVSTALQMLGSALEAIAADPTSNTVAESALAMPVKYRSARKSGHMSVLLDESAVLTPKIDKSRVLQSIDLTAKLTITTSDGSQFMQRALDLLRGISRSRWALLSSSNVSQMQKALSQITLMSSALAVPMNYSTLNIVLQSLVSREVARSRERYAIQDETSHSTYEELQMWPQPACTPHEQAPELFKSDLEELLHDMPQSWSIVSLGLSQDRKELLLSKIEAGSSPFLMRVPLRRPDIDDSQSREFTFEDAKTELLDVIHKAAVSSHDDRGQGDKQARKNWFAEREALDRRFETLLMNIENVWLGGFRGLLVSEVVDSSLLSRFGQSLSNSLDVHLPSRQKASKTATRVNLHAHVLELFVMLPFDEESSDLEDSVTDLLYFVTDILQFNDEPNAYDEIDFDALLVDVLDALRSYHAMKPPHTTRHTILILDKELEAFPWESLRILHQQPVSRMPSLGAIKERLDLIRAQSPTADNLTIPVDKGAYILNPSGDLTATQSTFEPLLSSKLPHYQPLINTAPNEPQFQTLLTSNSLLLYFGHGSGAQYIRKRLIRRLSNTAVTWLMGCSSVRMTEVGEFESYGVCSAYIFGGSPAVVGTLWDVTDRDLDRASLRGLSCWGLLDEEEEGSQADQSKSKSKAKGKGKEVVKDSHTNAAVSDQVVQGSDIWLKHKHLNKEERRGKVSIDEAVAAAREACRLRYLNGAALVVYGVPVVLAS